MTDLNTLIPPESPKFLLEAVGINDRGQIAGFGHLPDGEVHGYVLTPCTNWGSGRLRPRPATTSAVPSLLGASLATPGTARSP
jgi:hypothetical protein